jgi:pimeloyl-ACP methyl ester carboxylesterase
VDDLGDGTGALGYNCGVSLASANALFVKDRQFMTSDGTTIAYTVVGDAPKGRASEASRRPGPSGLGGEPRTPVVFMNGWTCPDAYWKRIGPPVVAAGHPAVFFDTRGHCQSGLPREAGFCARKLRTEDVSVVSVERLARDMIELIEAAGFERAVLAGHSMGVQAIFEAYRIAPERIAAIVPIAGTYENPVPTFAGLAVLDVLFPVGDFIFRRIPFRLLRPVLAQTSRLPGIGVRAVRLLRVANATVTAEDMAPHVAQFSELDLSVLWRIMAEMRRHSAADVLPVVQVPVLILAGRKDLFTPLFVQERMHALLADSELVIFDEGGHLLPVEEADGIAASMVEFLADRVDPPGNPAAPVPPDQSKSVR